MHARACADRQRLSNFKLSFHDERGSRLPDGFSRYEKPVASAATRVAARRLRVVAASVKSGAGGGQVREDREIADGPGPGEGELAI